jgi:hypothetical protein
MLVRQAKLGLMIEVDLSRRFLRVAQVRFGGLRTPYFPIFSGTQPWADIRGHSQSLPWHEFEPQSGAEDTI